MNKNVCLCRRSVAFFHALRVDLHRALFSRRFLLTVGLMLSWVFVNGCSNIFIFDFLYEFGIPYTFDEAMTGHDGLGMIVLSMATIPYSTSYLLDRESGFDYHAIKRVGFTAYTSARLVSVGLSSFLAMIFASGIFLIGLCFSGAPQTIPGNGLFFNGVYYDLVVQVGPWCYYLVRFIISGLTASLASVLALYSTVVIPNDYVALLSPLICYYIYDAIIMGVILQIFNRSSFLRLFAIGNIISGQVSRNNGFSFMWSVIFLLTMTALCGRGFVLRLRKEQGL